MRIVVTGATGTLGRQVVDLLAARGGHEVVAVSRRRAADLPPGVTPARADYADRTALRTAFAGADTLVFVSSDGAAVQVLLHHENVIRAATAVGVGHVVALSGLDADITSPFCYAVTYGHTEQLLGESGLPVSITRTSIFAEFFVRSFVSPVRGQIRLPAENGRISLISITDVSRSLVALAVAPPTGRLHQLTGPAALDMHDVAAEATRAWGAPVSYVDLAPADFQRQLAADDLAPWWCYAFSSMFASVRLNRWSHVTDDVYRLTHRQPQALRDLIAN